MKKRLLLIALAVVICFSTMTSTAFAVEQISISNIVPMISENYEIMPIDGTETWNKSYAIVGSFTLEGNNLTPVKTTGRSGELHITMYYKVPNLAKKVKILVQIRDANTQVTLIEWKTSATTLMESWESSTGLNVYSGEKIQVYFKVLDENGNYLPNQKVQVEYGYRYR